MELSELNERLALTFEAKPEPRETALLDTPEFSETKAWIFTDTGYAGGDNPVVVAADFTAPYWTMRLIVEHKIELSWIASANEWRAAQDGAFYHHKGMYGVSAENPAHAVALCALKVREER